VSLSLKKGKLQDRQAPEDSRRGNRADRGAISWKGVRDYNYQGGQPIQSPLLSLELGSDPGREHEEMRKPIGAHQRGQSKEKRYRQGSGQAEGGKKKRFSPETQGSQERRANPSPQGPEGPYLENSVRGAQLFEKGGISPTCGK